MVDERGTAPQRLKMRGHGGGVQVGTDPHDLEQRDDVIEQPPGDRASEPPVRERLGLDEDAAV